MNRRGLGTACLIGAAVGFIAPSRAALTIYSYHYADPVAYLVLGVLFLLPLTVLVVGIRLVRPRPEVPDVSDEARVE